MMSLENLGDPVTFVRSPTIMKELPFSMVSASRPLRRVADGGVEGLRGG